MSSVSYRPAPPASESRAMARTLAAQRLAAQWSRDEDLVYASTKGTPLQARTRTAGSSPPRSAQALNGLASTRFATPRRRGGSRPVCRSRWSAASLVTLTPGSPCVPTCMPCLATCQRAIYSPPPWDERDPSARCTGRRTMPVTGGVFLVAQDPLGHERLAAPLQLRGHHRPPTSAPAMARTRSAARPTTRPTSSSATPAAHASRISASRWASAASCSLRAHRSASPAAASADVTFARSVITTSPHSPPRSPRPRGRGPPACCEQPLAVAFGGHDNRGLALRDGSYCDAEVVAYGHRATERAAEPVRSGGRRRSTCSPRPAGASARPGRRTRALRALLRHRL